MSVLIPIVFVLFVIALIVYILRRDSDVDYGKDPLKVNIPFTQYALTPSRWAWRKIRENKAFVFGFVTITVFSFWGYAKWSLVG